MARLRGSTYVRHLAHPTYQSACFTPVPRNKLYFHEKIFRKLHDLSCYMNYQLLHDREANLRANNKYHQMRCVCDVITSIHRIK